MNNLTDRESTLRDAIISLASSFRAVHCIGALLAVADRQNATTNSAEDLLTKVCFSELRDAIRFFTPGVEFSDSEIFMVLTQLRGWLAYQLEDTKIWNNFTDSGNKCPVMASTHDMSDTALANYFHSMSELHSLSQVDLSWLAPHIQGMRVLDFGCGSGFFLTRLINLGGQVLGVDRPEIVELYHKVEAKMDRQVISVPTLDECLRSGIVKRFGVVWLSEVLHGKDNPVQFVDSLFGKYVSAGGKIIINELGNNNARRVWFNLQMMVHCGCPGADNLEAIERSNRFNVVDRGRISDFHETIIVEEKQ